MRLLLAAILLFQAAPAQSEADKLEAALKKFGERSYRILEKGRQTGTLVLKSRIEGDKEQKLIIEDQIHKQEGDTVVVREFEEWSSVTGLRFIRGSRSISGETNSTSRIDKDGDAFVSDGGRQLILREAGKAVGERTLLRLLCMKEQKVGAEFTADVLALDPAEFHERTRFNCVSKETLEVAGRKLETHKWEQKWESKATISGTTKVDNSFWVSQDGYLVKFILKGVEMVLDSK